MTTYQDPPLQSRRSVRQQNEAAPAPAAVVPTTGPEPTPVAPAAPAEPLTYATQGRTPVPDYDGPGLRTRRTPAPADAPVEAHDRDFRARDFSPEGRGAAPAWAPTYAGSPADTGAVAPSALDTDDPVEHTLTRRELRALRDAHGITVPEDTDPAAPAAAAPAAPVAPAADPGTPLAAPSTRLDSALAEFDQLAAGRPAPVAPEHPAPRGRRAAPQAAQPVAEAPAAAAPVAPAPVTPEPVASAPAAPEPVAPAPAGPAQVAPERLAPVPLVEPPAPAAAPAATVVPEPVVVEAPAEVPAPVAEAPAAETPADGVAVFDALFATPEPAAAPAAAPAPEPVQQAPAVQPEPVQQAPVAPVQPEPTPPVETEVVVAEIVLEPEPEAAPAASAEPSTSTPPTGHWTTQAQLDDETQFGDASLSRNIGATSGAITTSALVLPSIPNHEFGPLASGEIMVTGSISLPSSLSATGAHPAQIDEHDLDHLLDPGDHQVASTDSQPVRAIKAVSTHTSSRGVIGTVKPKGTRGLTALIIAATSMAVIVGALFIVLVATGQLG